MEEEEVVHVISQVPSHAVPQKYRREALEPALRAGTADHEQQIYAADMILAFSSCFKRMPKMMADTLLAGGSISGKHVSKKEYDRMIETGLDPEEMAQMEAIRQASETKH